MIMDIKKILYQLKSFNVKFVIIGGQAVIMQGAVHLTEDIDICYARDKENLENLVKALIAFHPYLRGAEKNLPFIFEVKTLEMGLNFTFSTDIGDIDLIGEISGIGNYNEVLKYSEILEIYGMQCNVLTIEGLIKSKKAVGRPKDEPVIKELDALLEIRKRKETNKDG